MSDDARLELDESGHALDSGPAGALDLGDPASVQAMPPSRVESWLRATYDEHARPWLHAHRRALTVAAVVAALVLGTTTWWTTRPPYVAPTVSLDLTNAILEGNDLGGPEIDPSSVLSVAYVARALSPGERVEVLGLAGPGLAPVDPPVAQPVVTSSENARLVLRARIACDRTVATALPTSYQLQVRRTDAGGGVVEGVVPLGGSTTALDIAVRDHCLEAAAAGLSLRAATVETTDGSPVAQLSLTVDNASALPLSVATERTPDDPVEVDLSPAITVEPGTAVLTTRLLVHDCTSPASAGRLGEQAGAGGSQELPTVLVRVGLGSSSRLWSLPWGDDGADVADRLASSACAGRPTVRATLAEASGLRTSDGSWLVTGVYDVRTSGVGVTVGREHFTGPAAGEGSTLATTDRRVPGSIWAIAPTQLDGGAGRVNVSFSGSSCTDLAFATPDTMAVRVRAADRRVYPFEIPADDERLILAAYDACGVTPYSPPTERGWRPAPPA